MTHPPLPRRAVLLTALLLVGTVLAGLGFAPATRATAAPPSNALVRVDIEQLTPAVGTPTDTITIRGRVTNVSGGELYNLQVLMWRNQAPYTDPEQLASVLTSGSDEPFGSPMINTGNFLDLTRSVASPDLQPSLAAGAALPFTVTGTVEQLGIPQYDATYLLGAVVRGSATADDPSRYIIGRARSLFPVLAEGSDEQTSLTSVVLLSSVPARIGTTEFVDDHLATEIAEDGRLTALLASAARADVSWAVDPDLIDSLEAMSRGYQVRTPTGPVPGKGAVDAQRWLEAFDELERPAGYRLDYAHPDLSAVAHHKATSVMTASRQAGERVERTTELPLLALPADGLADEDTLELALRQQPRVVLLSSASTSTELVGRADGTPVVSFDAEAFGGGPGPEPVTPVKVRQRMLTDALLATQQGAPVVRLITDAEQARLDQAGTAPYLERTTLAELAALDPERGYPDLQIPESASAELTDPQMQLITSLRRNYAAYAELLVDPGDIGARSDQMLARAGSSGWRGRVDEQRTFLTPSLDEIGGILSGDAVTLGESVPTVLTGAGGSFPLTITNRLDVPVRVKINIQSSNSNRLRVLQPDEIVVQPGERAQVTIESEPASNGEVAVIAQLTTVSGTELGRPATRIVTVTQYGTVGWAIAVLAGVAFFLASALRIRQVRRERAGAAATATAGPGLTTSAPASDAVAALPVGRPTDPGDVLTGTVQTPDDPVRPPERADD